MLTLNDGRAELWQWDTGRTLSVDADCSQVHFSNKVFGRSIDVDVADGAAVIPDILLQTDKDLNVWAFVGTAENGYTKISKTFKVNRRNKPADYVFTPPEQTTLAELSGRLDRIEESQDPDAIKNVVDDYLKQNPVEVPVQSVNGQIGVVELTANDVGAIADETDPTVPDWAKQPTKPSYTAEEVGALPTSTVIPTVPDNVSAFRNDAGYLTEHQDISGKLDASELPTAINTALAQAKASGEFDGADGAPGKDGADGITPTIGDNGNWYLGDADTGKPSRGEPGQDGADGKDGAAGADGADGYTPVKGKDYFTAADKQEIAEAAAGMVSIPDKLPNPNPLTFTGAVTGNYDGSAPLTVEIPSGGGSSGGGSGFQRIIDFTTEEGVTQFSTPALTQEQGDAISDASVMNIVLYVPIDSNDTETSTNGTVNINFYIGWSSDIVRNFKAIPAPTETHQAYGVWNFQVFKHPKSYAYLSNNNEPLLVIAYGQFKNTPHIAPVLSSTTDTLKWAKSGYYFTVTGSQNMAAGTRFIVEVGI